MYEALIPISDREPVRRNVDRARLLFYTLDHFWTDAAPLRLHVVVPDDEKLQLHAGLFTDLSTDKLSINFITESQLSGEISAIPASMGYAKQMLIKLAAFQIVSSPFCLILDTDVVCCKPTGLNSFFSNSRAASDWITPTMWEWWFESAKVLGIQLKPEDLQKPRLGVTPQILNMEVLKQLVERINGLGEGGWVQVLMNKYSGNHPHVWTEYTLYDLFATYAGSLLKFHLRPDEIIREQEIQCKNQNVWSIEDYAVWDPNEALAAHGSGHFLVLQSIIGASIDFDQIRQRWLEAMSKSVG